MKYLLLIIFLLFSCNKNSSATNLCLDAESDVDNDGICDDVDDCVGQYDQCGVCNGVDADQDNICDSNDDCVGQYDCLEVCNGSTLWCVNEDGMIDNVHDFQNNGSITSAVFMDDANVGSTGDVLAAFVGDELRGVAIPTEVPFGPYAGTYQFLMLVYSNAGGGENLSFQFYDYETDTIYNINQSFEFVSDMMHGNVISPILFQIIE